MAPFPDVWTESSDLAGGMQPFSPYIIDPLRMQINRLHRSIMQDVKFFRPRAPKMRSVQQSINKTAPVFTKAALHQALCPVLAYHDTFDAKAWLY
jgi:hypothetical protein